MSGGSGVRVERCETGRVNFFAFKIRMFECYCSYGKPKRFFSYADSHTDNGPACRGT